MCSRLKAKSRRKSPIHYKPSFRRQKRILLPPRRRKTRKLTICFSRAITKRVSRKATYGQNHLIRQPPGISKQLRGIRISLSPSPASRRTGSCDIGSSNFSRKRSEEHTSEL